MNLIFSLGGPNWLRVRTKLFNALVLSKVPYGLATLPMPPCPPIFFKEKQMRYNYKSRRQAKIEILKKLVFEIDDLLDMRNQFKEKSVLYDIFGQEFKVSKVSEGAVFMRRKVDSVDNKFTRLRFNEKKFFKTKTKLNTWLRFQLQQDIDCEQEEMRDAENQIRYHESVVKQKEKEMQRLK